MEMTCLSLVSAMASTVTKILREGNIMMKRTVDMILGDWGNDAGGRTSLVRARVIGEDITNEALLQARLRATEASGVDLNEILCDYEDNELFGGAAEEILKAGMKLRPREVFEVGFTISEDDMEDLIEEGLLPEGSGRDFSAGSLLLEYFGYGIEGFKYKVIDYRENLIVGGSNLPLDRFGYGLSN